MNRSFTFSIGAGIGSCEIRSHPQIKKTKSDASGFVYAIECGNKVKIGWAKNPSKRLRTLQTGNAIELRLITQAHFENARLVESIWHKRLAKFQTIGEWFNIPENIMPAVTETIKANLIPDAEYESSSSSICDMCGGIGYSGGWCFFCFQPMKREHLKREE